MPKFSDSTVAFAVVSADVNVFSTLNVCYIIEILSTTRAAYISLTLISLVRTRVLSIFRAAVGALFTVQKRVLPVLISASAGVAISCTEPLISVIYVIDACIIAFFRSYISTQIGLILEPNDTKIAGLHAEVLIIMLIRERSAVILLDALLLVLLAIRAH